MTAAPRRLRPGRRALLPSTADEGGGLCRQDFSDQRQQRRLWRAPYERATYRRCWRWSHTPPRCGPIDVYSRQDSSSRWWHKLVGYWSGPLVSVTAVTEVSGRAVASVGWMSERRGRSGGSIPFACYRWTMAVTSIGSDASSDCQRRCGSRNASASINAWSIRAVRLSSSTGRSSSARVASRGSSAGRPSHSGRGSPNMTCSRYRRPAW